MWYPLQNDWLLLVVLGGLALAAVSGVAMMRRPIQYPPEALWGIVAFELAGNPDAAQPMLESWQASDRLDNLRFNLQIDFAFLLGYALALSAGCALVASHLDGIWAMLGAALAWGAWVAGLLDAVENIMLLQVLDRFEHGQLGVATSELATARICARVKFVLVGVSLLYYCLGAAFSLASSGVRV